MNSYNPHYAPPATPRNGLGLAALILGLVALPSLLTGLTAWIGIVLGLVAVPLALVGLARVRRGTATNRGVSIAGAVLGLVAIVGGIASTVATVQALDEVLSGPTATVAAPGADAAADAAADEQPAEPVALGTAVDVDGLTVTVTEISRENDYGKTLTCASVAYANGRDDVAHRNPLDWSARNAQGASVSAWIYTGTGALDSGTLAPGGSDDGLVCFDVPRDEVAVVEYRAGLASAPTAEWAAA